MRLVDSRPFIVSCSIALVSACSAGTAGLLDDGGGAGGVGPSLAVATATTDAAVTSTAAQFMTGASGGGGTNCDALPDEDKDGDGFTINDGDCNDCDANVNPNALEVMITEPDPMTGMVPEPADEDCDGTVDNVAPPSCDGGLAIDSASATDAAHAIELCKDASGTGDWGLVSASYVRANGDPTTASLQTGILDGFGPNVAPRGGSQMLVLSSGHARTPDQPGACGSLTCSVNGSGTAPPGFPQNAPGCTISDVINDDIGLQVDLIAPSNATGYKFDFDFYSFEYPEWVCTTFNDQFMALVAPAPMGSLDGNISFDSMNNPVSVNVAFFNVCAGCSLGTAELTGTGFDVWDDAGATSWLQTVAPVSGNDHVTIRFAMWDTGDTAWDSTTLIDNFQWIASGGTVTIGTTPVPPQ